MLPSPSQMPTPRAERDADDGVDARLETGADAGEHHGGRAGARRLGDLADRRGLGGREVLGEPAEHLGEHEADDDGAEALPAGIELVVADVAERDDRGTDDGQQPRR